MNLSLILDIEYPRKFKYKRNHILWLKTRYETCSYNVKNNNNNLLVKSNNPELVNLGPVYISLRCDSYAHRGAGTWTKIFSDELIKINDTTKLHHITNKVVCTKCGVKIKKTYFVHTVALTEPKSALNYYKFKSPSTISAISEAFNELNAQLTNYKFKIKHITHYGWSHRANRYGMQSGNHYTIFWNYKRRKHTHRRHTHHTHKRKDKSD